MAKVSILLAKIKCKLLYFIIIKGCLRSKKMPGRRNLSPHSQPHPPLFYNNKILDKRTHHLKKSYQQDKEFIVCGLLPASVPIALTCMQVVKLLVYLLFIIY
ncbi:hypothetical protein HDR62_04015 [bacterium]|nr:hypothetical protein [bacterium]